MLTVRAFQNMVSRQLPVDGVQILCTEVEAQSPRFYPWLQSCILTRFGPNQPRVIQIVLPPATRETRETNNGKFDA